MIKYKEDLIKEMFDKGKIEIPIYHNKIDIDEDSIRDEFEEKLKLLLEGVESEEYVERLKEI